MTTNIANRDTVMPGVDLCGLPMGPFATEDAVISAVKGWAANPRTNGGAFGIWSWTFERRTVPVLYVMLDASVLAVIAETY